MTSRFILYTLSSTFRAYKKRLHSAVRMRKRQQIFSTIVIPLLSCSRVSPSCDSARTEPRESRCLRNRCSPENLARGVRAIRFLGSDYATAPTSSSSRTTLSTSSSSSCWRSRDCYFLVTTRSRDSALRISSCNDCGQLLRATH
jgi:hypothetical protein